MRRDRRPQLPLRASEQMPPRNAGASHSEKRSPLNPLLRVLGDSCSSETPTELTGSGKGSQVVGLKQRKRLTEEPAGRSPALGMRLLRPPPPSAELSLLGGQLCSPHTAPAAWPAALSTPLRARSLATVPSGARAVCTVDMCALGFF